MSLIENIKSILIQLGYEHIDFLSQSDFLSNWQRQLMKLNQSNNLVLSDEDWKNFFRQEVLSSNYSWEDKLIRMHSGEYIYRFVKSNGKACDIKCMDKEELNNNSFQFVTNHCNEDGQERSSRPRVTILINGFPMAHIEISDAEKIRESFESMDKDMEWRRDCILNSWDALDFIKIFVISNLVKTKYFSCSTWSNFFKSKGEVYRKNIQEAFRFTSKWTDDKNKAFNDLSSFILSFFPRENLWNMIVNFSVLAYSRQDKTIDFKVMRPYQVHATKSVLDKIKSAVSENGRAAGYVWHSTGSGKTLTSFKVCKLASQIPTIQKVLFVVDRRDLDNQTKNNFGDYEFYESSKSFHATSTYELLEHLRDTEVKVIVTTIQKLSRCIKSDNYHPKDIFKKHMVIIFDECHRSQSGDMRKVIHNNCLNSHMFGFTGTPIFENSIIDNESNSVVRVSASTPTAHLFEEQVHSYTLFNAISDKNVLKFKVDFPYKDSKEENKPKNLDPKFMREKWIPMVSNFLVENFDFYTYRNTMSEGMSGKHNSILTVNSIECAKEYYRYLSKYKDRLKIAIIYTDKDEKGVGSGRPQDEELYFENSLKFENVMKSDEKFFQKIIRNYNQMFDTNYSVDTFQSYYEDIANRIKMGEIDILIVVNMFLTGFDAPVLSTLWVDKPLKFHNLVQAFSRTNRLYGERKKYGNIICFQTSEDDMKSALMQHASSQDKKDVDELISKVIAKPFKEAYQRYLSSAEKLKKYIKEPGIIEVQKNEWRDFKKEWQEFQEQENNIQTYMDFELEKKENIVFSDDERKQFKDTFNTLKRQNSNWNKLNKLPEKSNTKALEKVIVDSFDFKKSVVVDDGFFIGLKVSELKEEVLSSEQIEQYKKRVEEMIQVSNVSDKNWCKQITDDFLESRTNEEGLKDWNDFLARKLEDELDELVKKENLNQQNTLILFAHSLSSLKEFPIDDEKIINECMSGGFENSSYQDRLNQLSRVKENLQDLVIRYSSFRSYLNNWVKKYGVLIRSESHE